MRFIETELKGVLIIEPEKRKDERGFFARTWCQDEFGSQGLNTKLAQCSISFNRRRGTLRGMHYQIAPFAEAKVVRCTRGSLYDVVIDLRPKSSTFGSWMAVTLTAENYRMLYIPETFAHGFQTLEDDTEVYYQISEFYNPEAARGIRWDDPRFTIRWPEIPPILSERDRAFPDFVRDSGERRVKT